MAWSLSPRLRDVLRPVLGRLEGLWLRLSQGPLGRLLGPLIAKLRALGLVSSPNRFVLTIGDEGATLVKFQGDRVVDALFVGPESEDGEETLRSELTVDAQAQITVAADVLEQMYREEPLPRVSRWDRRNIIKRRLEVAFPHDRLKAAVSLDRAKDGGSTILFTALPETPYIAQWSTFLESLPNVVHGFCLLPLESEGLAARLCPPAEADGRRTWHALVSQQATSGFRQIFESEGNLVVTRLTQRPPGELSAEAVAQLIERELRSSISYIKRLGYSDADRLDLVVLASSDICEAVKARDLPVSTLTALTPGQAAHNLGFGPVGPEDSPYSDVLHAVNLAVAGRPRATLPTAKMAERQKIEWAFRIGFAAAAAISLIAVLYVGSIIVDSIDTLTTEQTLARSVATETQVLESLRQKAHGFAVPLEELVAVGQTDDTLKKAQLDPSEVMRTVGSILDPSVKVQRITFTAPPMALLSGPPPPLVRGARRAPDFAYDLQLVLRLSDETPGQPDHAALRTRQLRDSLIKAFPGHDVSIVHVPYATLRTQVLQGGVGGRPIPENAEAALAEYLIRKRV